MFFSKSNTAVDTPKREPDAELPYSAASVIDTGFNLPIPLEVPTRISDGIAVELVALREEGDTLETRRAANIALLAHIDVALTAVRLTIEAHQKLLGDLEMNLGKEPAAPDGNIIKVEEIAERFANGGPDLTEEEADHGVDRHIPEHRDNRPDFGDRRSKD